MLTTEQQDFYDQNGYLMVENVITKDQLNKLQTITYEFIEASRNIQENDDVYDLDEGHSAETPRLTRIKLPHKQNKYFDEILKNLDKQGAIEENMLFLSRQTALDFDDMIAAGVAKEQARMVLPQNLYTSYWGTVNLSNLWKFYKLRSHEGAQWEIQQVANACIQIAKNYWPDSIQALLENNP